MPAGVSAFMLAFSLVMSFAWAEMISWKISLVFALRARFLWLRYAMYLRATSLRGLFISSNSTQSWISSTVILSADLRLIVSAIFAARTMSSPASVTSIALRIAATIFWLLKSTKRPSRLTTYFTIIRVKLICEC